MDNSFTNCYLSQVDASFPSYMHDGKFSDLAKKIWVDQLKDVQLILGKDYFYQNESPRIRTTHGLLFFKEMNVEEFLVEGRLPDFTKALNNEILISKHLANRLGFGVGDSFQTKRSH